MTTKNIWVSLLFACTQGCGSILGVDFDAPPKTSPDAGADASVADASVDQDSGDVSLDHHADASDTAERDAGRLEPDADARGVDEGLDSGSQDEDFVADHIDETLDASDAAEEDAVADHINEMIDASDAAEEYAVADHIDETLDSSEVPEADAGDGSSRYGGTWSWMAHTEPFFPGNLFLMVDGRVMITDIASNQTSFLTPGADGTYWNGTWSPGPSLLDNVAYYSSAVLPDGSVIICGGELLDGVVPATNALCERLPFGATAWQRVTSPAGLPNILDMAGAVLPNGNFFLFGWSDPNGSPITPSQIYDASTDTWSASGTSLYDDRENGLALTQDGTLLTVRTWIQRLPSVAAEKYVARTGAWVETPGLPSSLGDAIYGAMGPGITLVDGRVLFLGENGKSALYSPGPTDDSPGSWNMGPMLPVIDGQQTGARDGAAVLLPNGKVFLAAESLSGSPQTYFFDFDPVANTITRVQPDPPAPLGNHDSSNVQFLLTPDGNVLAYINNTTLFIYTPDGSPLDSAKPSLSLIDFPPVMQRGSTYPFSGYQLHGLSQGSAYGDEYQNPTNYPIAKFVNNITQNVYYVPTFNHSTMSTAPGLFSSTNLTIPSSMPTGNYVVSVVVNGVPSSNTRAVRIL
jgi:hypothetical protein